MNKLFSFVLFLFMACTTSAQKQDGAFLLYNATIVQVDNGHLLHNMAVLIDGRVIKTVGKYSQLQREAPNAIRIDCKAKFLIPGLWDMHVHLEGADLVEDNKALLPVFLAYGITTIRDCASDLGEQVLAWRKEIQEGKLIGPTIYTAGRKLEGKNSIWKGDLEIENEVELKQMLDLLDSYKVDFVKITENTLGGDLFLKSVQAAKTRGYRVSGHVPIDLTIEELVKAGYTSVEHASYLLRLGSNESEIVNDLRSGKITRAEAESKYAAGFDQEVALRRYSDMGKAGLFVCPTLIGGRQLAYLDETDHSTDAFQNYLTKKFTANYQWRIGRMAGDTPEQRMQRKERYAFLRKQLPLIQKSGITIIAGSDAAALNTFVYPAESLIQELEIFQESGMAPLQILQSATINGATYFGIQNKTATIAAGKDADLVLLDKNPLENINVVRTVHSVFAQGIYYNRERLDALLRQARETKVRLDNTDR